MDGRSRRGLIVGGLAGLAAVAGVMSGIGRPAAAQAPSPKQDERILNFLLGLLPGRVSNGCIRLRNDDILALERLMPVGTPLTIR